ncbi:LOW QUALITY PROTEIN: hypothetical protein HID58_082996 [Brassica napus]|uniref:Disease resistance protein Roq1-like winged-helix domain-containing protein n=1 Tax=Brassica napus TaxID=3708 RepID=A0ABQ7YF96_BRANA|nr:LOW QUALITY PROTEIN: hypothetical protein HID58_082996 [Brassica napus]
MIKKIAKDVIDKLNATPSKDFDGMEGLDAHLTEMDLDENDQSLFLHIAVFFNYKDGDLVKAISADCDHLEVKRGLQILANRSLIDLSTNGKRIVVHNLLQQMARQAIHKQEPGKRQVLVNADEICGVLENETGTGVVSGISFDISRINEVSIGKKAFKKMPNLRFLSVYKSRADGNDSDVPASIAMWSRLESLSMWNNGKLKAITHLPLNVLCVNVSYSGIEKIPDCMKALHQLQELNLLCVFHMKHTPDAVLSFINNFKLSQQARREIIIGSLFRGSALLPGREVPAEFHHHRARGNSLTIPHLRKTGNILTSQLLCCRIFGKDDLYPTDREFYIGDDVSNYRAEHLFIFHSHLLDDYINPANVRTEIMFEFSSPSSVFNITECGAKICTQQTIQGSYESGSERLYILHTLK